MYPVRIERVDNEMLDADRQKTKAGFLSREIPTSSSQESALANTSGSSFSSCDRQHHRYLDLSLLLPTTLRISFEKDITIAISIYFWIRHPVGG